MKKSGQPVKNLSAPFAPFLCLVVAACGGGSSTPTVSSAVLTTTGTTSGAATPVVTGSSTTAVTTAATTPTATGVTTAVTTSVTTPVTTAVTTPVTTPVTTAVTTPVTAPVTTVVSGSSTVIPGAPTITSVTAGDTVAIVTFTAPAVNGGTAATSYTATCRASGIAKSNTGTGSSITVSGLINGLAYTCAVTASNSAGAGVASSVAAVTPAASSATATALMAGYKQAKWSANMTVTYPTNCSMTITSNGQPNHALNAYYLEPVNIDPVYPNTVAVTPNSRMALTVRPYLPAATPVSNIVTFNTCPTKAATTTATTGGDIGIMISGSALFNATEGQLNGPAALTDNVSYTGVAYKNGVSTGVTATASFIDSCNGHPSPRTAGDTYHYHGVPTCITSVVDTVGGPSHLIGVAADGFPIYGGRDINGKVITLSQLDACNGITSATPEFPNGVYHYVLPEGVTNFQSSLMCYSGVITPRQMMAMKATGGICETPKTMLATTQPLTGPINMSRRVLKMAVLRDLRKVAG